MILARRRGANPTPHVRTPALADYTPTGYLSVPSPVADGADAYHPDVVDTVTGWNGYRYWMAFTPWPSDAEENPCIVASHDGTTWVVPPGASNPIDPTPITGYNSDTDLVWSASEGLMYCFYRWFGSDGWRYRTSGDGVRWSPEARVALNGLSPAFVKIGSTWRVWWVSDTTDTLRTASAASLAGPWSSPVSCTISLPPGGHVPWHMDVIRKAGKFYGLLYCHEGVSAPANMIVGITSSDGYAWGESTDILMRPSATFTQMYRATLQPAAGGFDVWAGLTIAGGGHRIARTFIPATEFQ